MLRIPVAQFPDIVPPQVSVTTRYPGASAERRRSRPSRSRSRARSTASTSMIYMRSNSGNDGSYTLTVSFELGTNPDIDTVNVNNRVQARPRAAAAGGAAPGRDGAQAILGAAAVHRRCTRESGAHDAAVPVELRHHQHRSTRSRACPASAQAILFGAHGLLHAHLVRDRPADQPGPDAGGRRRGDPGAERAGAGRAASARGRSADDQQFQLNIQTTRAA